VTDTHEQDLSLVRKRHVSGTHWSGMTLAGVSILTFTVVGVFINDDFGCIVGFVVGAVFGTIVACRVPSPHPGPRTEFLSVSRYRRIRFLYRWWALFVLVWFSGVLTFLASVRDDFVFWYLTLCGLPMLVHCAIGTFFVALLSDWRCPTCDNSFPRCGVLARYPHVCRHCGFAIHRKAESTEKRSNETLTT